MANNLSSSGAAVTASDFPEIRWHGNWIWCDPPAMPSMHPVADGSANAEKHALFRKTFSLTELPLRVPARVTADSRYLLYCNGQEVFRLFRVLPIKH
jgi:alpha-L-rhamnosidase